MTLDIAALRRYTVTRERQDALIATCKGIRDLARDWADRPGHWIVRTEALRQVLAVLDTEPEAERGEGAA